MFLNYDFSILNEAPEDETENNTTNNDQPEEDVTSDDYTVDDNVKDVDNNEEEPEQQEDPTDENTGEGEAPEENEAPTEEDPTDTTDAEGEEDLGEENLDDEEQNSSVSSDSYKKYNLLQKYKILLRDVNSLNNALINFKERIDLDLIENLEFIIQKNNELKNKIVHYIKNEFITAEYQILLTNFFYFKDQIDKQIDVIGTLVKYNYD